MDRRAPDTSSHRAWRARDGCQRIAATGKKSAGDEQPSGGAIARWVPEMSSRQMQECQRRAAIGRGECQMGAVDDQPPDGRVRVNTDGTEN